MWYLESALKAEAHLQILKGTNPKMEQVDHHRSANNPNELKGICSYELKGTYNAIF